MQQYFVDGLLKTGDEYIFTEQQAHHARDVLRMSRETVRLVDSAERAWFAECSGSRGSFSAKVIEEDPRINENGFELTLAAALIRREKFELVLQKAAELGVTRIVPFESSRCVVHAKKEKADRQMQRYREILRSAAEQCKRNRIPEITDVLRLDQLDSVLSEISLAAYENADVNSKKISDYRIENSVTVVIGPEGGFSEAEAEQLKQMGYEAVTLGSRILRAETAAVYACSVIAEGAIR